MTIALLVSLALALTFTPALAATLESGAARRAHQGPGDRLTARLSGIYSRALRWALAHRRIVLVLAAAVACGSVVAYRRVETGFIPEMDEGAFILDYWSPPGTSLEETVRLLGTVDTILQDTPEVAAFARRTGTELGFFLTETNRGDYAVRLRGGSRRPIEEIMDDVRERIHAQLPGLRVDFVQIMQDMIGDLSGNPTPIEIKLFGADQPGLERTARAVNTAIEGVAGVVDSFDGITQIGPTYQIAVDEQRAKLVGLSADAVQRWLETAITGTVVGQVLENDRAIPLRGRYADRFRTQLDSIDALTLVAAQGKPVPLHALAHVGAGPVAVQRTRENLRQLVRVTARLSQRDLGSVMRDVRSRLRQAVALPAGVS